jgi:site-specific DNA recombinase
VTTAPETNWGLAPAACADGLAAWAEASGHRQSRRNAGDGLRFAFYGRVSTEDWQDPESLRARQREQAEALVRGHGRVVAEFFDEGPAAVAR